MKNIVEGNRAQNTPQTDSTQYDEKNPKNAMIKYIYNRWKKIKKFMKREDASQWTIAALTLVIVVLTVITTYFNCRQINTYEIATHAELRAYLSINKIAPDTLIDGQGIKAEIVAMNTGQTPAYNVEHMYGVRIGTPATKGFFDTIETQFGNTNSYNVLGSKIEFGYIFDTETLFKLRKNDASNIYSGKSVLTLFGKFVYIDKFGDKHFLRYAGQINPKLRTADFLSTYNDGD